MFKTARLKLTLWYLVIIMFMSLSLSWLVYTGIDRITNRALMMQKSRMEKRMPLNPQFPDRGPIFETETLLEIRKNFLFSLFEINLIIFVFSGLSAYFLAGRTLKPIEKMVDDQERFIADASHELKTPITAMRTELEVVLRDKKSDKNEFLAVLTSNLQEVKNLQKLSEYLLKESKYQWGTYNFSPEAQDLERIVLDVVDSFQKAAKSRNIKLSSQTQAVQLKGDEQSLAELVSILLDNAIKFSPSGSVVNINLIRSGHSAIFSIQDRGVGIRKSDQPYIFNRFYQIDSSRTKIKNDGFGLGLSIAKKIAQLHRGEITLNSDLGKGSIFTVTLPLS